MANKRQLSKFAREKLGHYVYALRSPLDGALFYVGKGLDDRVLAHANGVIDQIVLDEDEVVESLKNDVINHSRSGSRGRMLYRSTRACES